MFALLKNGSMLYLTILDHAEIEIADSHHMNQVHILVKIVPWLPQNCSISCCCNGTPNAVFKLVVEMPKSLQEIGWRKIW